MANLLPLFCIFSQRIIMSSLINIEIASLNVRGMNDFTKRNLLFSSFEKSKFTVVFLQETKIDPSQHIEISNEWQNGPIFLNSVFEKKSGTIILFNTHQVKILNEIYDSDGRVIVLDVEIIQTGKSGSCSPDLRTSTWKCAPETENTKFPKFVHQSTRSSYR